MVASEKKPSPNNPKDNPSKNTTDNNPTETQAAKPPASDIAPTELKKEKEVKEVAPETTSLAKKSSLEKEDLAFPSESSLEEDFDWNAVSQSGFGEGYTEAESKTMKDLYQGTVSSIHEGDVVEGTIMEINDRDVILDIGFKSDGLVPRSEFKDLPDAKVGDKVDLFVETREDAMGQLILSRKKAKLVKSWNIIQKALEEGNVIESFVKRRTKGGLIVDLYGIEAFLPGSQIGVKPIRDFNIYVSKTIEVKVIKINYANNNIVVSHKILIEKDIEDQKAAILNNLEKGQVLEGVIKNITNFGVFIDLGGVDGLLHITDISWERISNPGDVLKLDQEAKVVVLDFDESKKRISLGMKQLLPHPWEALPSEIDKGSKVKGKVNNVVDYGAFLEIQPGVEGLVHISEMSWSQHLRNPQDFVNVGDELEAVVLSINREEKKMALGVKQLKEDPWTSKSLLTKYAVGTIHTGVVRNLTNFGLFVELEEGVDGLVHVSDLSWSKNIKHPHEFTKIGSSLEAMVLEIEPSLRRISLSHKHIEKNPWETFESIFLVGSIHNCTVLETTDKGSLLELPYGIESFCVKSNLVKKDGSPVEVGEKLDCKVAEFSLSDRRVVMSHKDTWSTDNKSVASTKKHSYPPKEKVAGKIKKKASDHSNSNSLGNLSPLRLLKQKMKDENEKSKLAKKK